MFLRKLPDQFTDFDDLLRIKTYCRLIQDNDLRESQNCLSKSDSLLITFSQVLAQPVVYGSQLCKSYNFFYLRLSFVFFNSF